MYTKCKQELPNLVSAEQDGTFPAVPALHIIVNSHCALKVSCQN